MATALLPWQIHSALAQDRLTAVAGILWRVRAEVSLRMEPGKGDTLWGAGCAAYERSCRALSDAAARDLKAWLSVARAENHFLIKIGGVPVRFYRGDPEEPTPTRYAVATDAEVAALQFAFHLADTPTPDKLFRIEVCTDTKSFPVSVSLAQVDNDRQKHNVFQIPVANSNIRNIVRKKSAVVLDAPQVKSLKDESAKPSGDTQTGTHEF